MNQLQIETLWDALEGLVTDIILHHNYKEADLQYLMEAPDVTFEEIKKYIKAEQFDSAIHTARLENEVGDEIQQSLTNIKNANEKSEEIEKSLEFLEKYPSYHPGYITDMRILLKDFMRVCDKDYVKKLIAFRELYLGIIPDPRQAHTPLPVISLGRRHATPLNLDKLGEAITLEDLKEKITFFTTILIEYLNPELAKVLNIKNENESLKIVNKQLVQENERNKIVGRFEKLLENLKVLRLNAEKMIPEAQNDDVAHIVTLLKKSINSEALSSISVRSLLKAYISTPIKNFLSRIYDRFYSGKKYSPEILHSILQGLIYGGHFLEGKNLLGQYPTDYLLPCEMSLSLLNLAIMQGASFEYIINLMHYEKYNNIKNNKPFIEKSIISKFSEVECIQLIESLMKKGLDINAEGMLGNRLLDYCVKKNKKEIFIFLILNGAEVEYSVTQEGLRLMFGHTESLSLIEYAKKSDYSFFYHFLKIMKENEIGFSNTDLVPEETSGEHVESEGPNAINRGINFIYIPPGNLRLPNLTPAHRTNSIRP